MQEQFTNNCGRRVCLAAHACVHPQQSVSSPPIRRCRCSLHNNLVSQPINPLPATRKRKISASTTGVLQPMGAQKTKQTKKLILGVSRVVATMHLSVRGVLILREAHRHRYCFFLSPPQIIRCMLDWLRPPAPGRNPRLVRHLACSPGNRFTGNVTQATGTVASIVVAVIVAAISRRSFKMKLIQVFDAGTVSSIILPKHKPNALAGPPVQNTNTPTNVTMT